MAITARDPEKLGAVVDEAVRLVAEGGPTQIELKIDARAVPAFERAMIEVALQHSQGRKRDAAELLGWGRNTLTRKIKELGLEDEQREVG